MSYPRNAASPPHFLVGYVYQISDGAVQTAGVSARVKTGTGSWGAAAGTLDCDTTSGAWTYTPTQGETNAEAFSVSLYKASCSGVGMTVITGRSANAGYVAPDWGQLTGVSSTVNLSGTTFKAVSDPVPLPSSASINITGNITGNLSGSVGSVTGAVGSVTGNVGGSVASVTGAVGSVTGNVGGSVASVTGNVGGNVTGSVGSVVAGGITSSSFAAGAITAASIAASALNGKGDWQTVIWSSPTATVNLSGTTIKAVTDSVAATVADKTGYKLASDGLAAISAWTVAITGNLTGNVSGSVNSVATTVSANVVQWNSGSLPTIPTAGENADAVWDEVMSGHTTAGTYGGRLPRSFNSNVEVQITGSRHIAADIHELQQGVIAATDFAAGAIDANALAADAASEIATAVRTELATELARIDVTVGSRLATIAYTAPLTAAGTRLAIGLAAANLDSQLDALPTAAEIDTQLSGTHGGGAWGSIGSGSGAYTFTVTVNDGTTALQNATVRLVEGVNNYVALTNASGVAVFALDAATYSVAISKAGYSFTPTTKVIANTTSQTYSMTAVTPTLPAAANLSTGTAICYGTTGLPLQGVVVTIQQVQGTGTDGSAYDGDTFTLTSNASGVISHNGFVRGATYSIRRGIRGEAKSFTVPNAVSFDLSEIVGRD